MNRIMLKFRPIAPKPTTIPADHETGSGAARREKRKYVRVRGRRGKQPARTKPPGKTPVEGETSPEDASVTLQLLPERSDEDLNSSDPRGADGVVIQEPPPAYSVDRNPGLWTAGSTIEMLVIVERVTDAFSAGQVGLGFSDREKMRSLENDTCPGFISDPANNVIWVNEAYRQMAAAGERGFVVRLVVEDVLPHFYPSFACRVRVVRQERQGQNWNRIVPCDVWRMGSAGFAWKLDVNTALSLSL